MRLSHDQLRALREVERHGCWDQRVHLPADLWDEHPEGYAVLSDEGRSIVNLPERAALSDNGGEDG